MRSSMKPFGAFLEVSSMRPPSLSSAATVARAAANTLKPSTSRRSEVDAYSVELHVCLRQPTNMFLPPARRLQMRNSSNAFVRMLAEDEVSLTV
jgi:hypothetical protein